MKKLEIIVLGGFLCIGTLIYFSYQFNIDTLNSLAKEENNRSSAIAKSNTSTSSKKLKRSPSPNDLTSDVLNLTNINLSNEVQSKLETDIPKGKLSVTSKEGVIFISGTVETQAQLDKILPLVLKVKGIKKVDVNVKVRQSFFYIRKLSRRIA